MCFFRSFYDTFSKLFSLLWGSPEWRMPEVGKEVAGVARCLHAHLRERGSRGGARHAGDLNEKQQQCETLIWEESSSLLSTAHSFSAEPSSQHAKERRGEKKPKLNKKTPKPKQKTHSQPTPASSLKEVRHDENSIKNYLKKCGHPNRAHPQACRCAGNWL